MNVQGANNTSILSPEMEKVRAASRRVIAEVQPAGPPASQEEGRGLILSSATKAGASLPRHYLVYFLFVELLEFPRLGAWEKSAWTVPIRYRGRLYGIEHRKYGMGIFAPNLMAGARQSVTPTEENERDASEICALVTKAVDVAEPYFEWRAEKEASGSNLNVVNNSEELFARYAFFRDRYRALKSEELARKGEVKKETSVFEGGGSSTSWTYPSHQLRREANWNALAAVEAFFSWTEHVFIHIAILLCHLKTGEDVAKLADSDWKSKFKAAIDLSDPASKQHYDNLLDLRAQVRNFVAHGSFGKRGEAFSFHSGAGAVPVLITRRQLHRYSLNGRPAFTEESAIDQIEDFLLYLWSGPRLPARQYLESEMPSILTFADDGTYAEAMSSSDAMDQCVDHLIRQAERAANMDF